MCVSVSVCVPVCLCVSLCVCFITWSPVLVLNVRNQDNWRLGELSLFPVTWSTLFFCTRYLTFLSSGKKRQKERKKKEVKQATQGAPHNQKKKKKEREEKKRKERKKEKKRKTATYLPFFFFWGGVKKHTWRRVREWGARNLTPSPLPHTLVDSLFRLLNDGESDSLGGGVCYLRRVSVEEFRR